MACPRDFLVDKSDSSADRESGRANKQSGRVNNRWTIFDKCLLRSLAGQLKVYTTMQPDEKLPRGIEVYEVGARRLYAKTTDQGFAIFEDELTPEELIAIARDIAARRDRFSQDAPLNSDAA